MVDSYTFDRALVCIPSTLSELVVIGGQLRLRPIRHHEIELPILIVDSSQLNIELDISFLGRVLEFPICMLGILII